ncbi:MAG: DNA polymerase III subunit delta [Gammaproteobacteria bacterium]|nr:DNA polymerase III subunit delta [Gammaproteobacteria bacterium]
MPIKPEQLSKHLKPLLPCYLITGDEYLLIMEAQDAIRSAAKEQGFTERQVHEVNKQFSFNELSADANNMSLFAEKRIIELRFEKLPDKDQQKSLDELTANSPEDTVWLITCPKMDKRKLSVKWVKNIEINGCVVQVWPIASYQLTQWLSQRAASAGVKLTSGALQFLADSCEGNLLAAKQDLEKLQLIRSDQPLDVSELKEAISNNARFNVFELIDTALAGHVQKANVMLSQLKQEGVVPVIVIATLYRECKTLFSMSSEVSKGKSVTDVVREYRVWSNRTRLISQALNKVPSAVWQRLVSRCAHLDKVAKGQEEGNVWDELMTCLLLMGGTPLWRKVLS